MWNLTLATEAGKYEFCSSHLPPQVPPDPATVGAGYGNQHDCSWDGRGPRNFVEGCCSSHPFGCGICRRRILLFLSPAETDREAPSYSPTSPIRTGDAVYDGALKQALEADLEQSPFLNLQKVFEGDCCQGIELATTHGV